VPLSGEGCLASPRFDAPEGITPARRYQTKTHTPRLLTAVSYFMA
jgi:hypothetical protein